MNTEARALYRAAWVLPVASPPIRDGAVLVDETGLIADVAPAAVLPVPDGIRIVELGEAILLPGLINTHAHAELAMFRGALEELSFREWIVRLVGAKRTALTDDDYLWAARWTAIEAIRAGITTLACTESSSGALHALGEAGLRAIVYQEVFGPDPHQVDESLNEIRGRLERLRKLESDLIRVGISPHAPFTVSDRLYTLTMELAIEEGLPIAVHIAESAEERALVTRGDGDFARGLRARGIDTPVRGESPIDLLDRLGVLRARPLLIHCLDVDAEDIRRIADSGSAVAHCPIANAKLGHGVAPLPELIAAGAIVGLGTDSVASNNRLDMLEEARTTSLLQRARLRQPAAVTAEELLRLCTTEGARALGLNDRVGTLEPGMEADLCAVSVSAPHTRPIHDPVAALFHSARGNDVILTVVRGRTLFADGEVVGADVPAAEAAIDECAARIRELR